MISPSAVLGASDPRGLQAHASLIWRVLAHWGDHVSLPAPLLFTIILLLLILLLPIIPPHPIHHIPLMLPVFPAHHHSAFSDPSSFLLFLTLLRPRPSS